MRERVAALIESLRGTPFETRHYCVRSECGLCPIAQAAINANLVSLGEAIAYVFGEADDGALDVENVAWFLNDWASEDLGERLDLDDEDIGQILMAADGEYGADFDTRAALLALTYDTENGAPPRLDLE